MSSEVKTEPKELTKEGEVAKESNTLYIDASEQIAGRMCSIVARELLSGKRVIVLNAEKALVSGRSSSVFRQWQTRLEIYSHVNPIYGPIHPRRPDNIIRRMVRGMVPKTKSSGKTAMGRLRVYMGVPREIRRREDQQVRPRDGEEADPAVYDDSGDREEHRME